MGNNSSSINNQHKFNLFQIQKETHPPQQTSPIHTDTEQSYTNPKEYNTTLKLLLLLYSFHKDFQPAE